MKKDCTTTKKTLWGTETNTNHEWRYKNRETRKCVNCGRVEMFFGNNLNGGYIIEDWRPKL